MQHHSYTRTTYVFLLCCMTKLTFTLVLVLLDYGNKDIKNEGNMKETVPCLVSHLGGYNLPPEFGALQIQALHHRPERVHLHYPIREAIRCYPLRNGSPKAMVGCCIGTIGGGCKGVSHEGYIPKGFRLRRGGAGSLCIGKGSPLASHSEARAAVAARSSWVAGVVGQDMVGCTSP